MTTITGRSFSGSGFAQFASALLVCAGVMLLLPEPVSSDHDGMPDAGTSVCRVSPDAVRNHQWTDDVAVNDPDSCDDGDEDDDDGDDESSGGSGHAIAGGHHGPAHLDLSATLFHVAVGLRSSRPLGAPSLRGPPSVHQKSSDADSDGEDDDHDSERACHSVLLAAANSRDPGLLSTPEFSRAASIGSGHAVRAPP